MRPVFHVYDVSIVFGLLQLPMMQLPRTQHTYTSPHTCTSPFRKNGRCGNLTRSHEGSHESSSALAVLLSHFVRSLVLLHLLAFLLTLLLAGA